MNRQDFVKRESFSRSLTLAACTAVVVLCALSLASSARAQTTGLMALYTFNGTLQDASGNGKLGKDTGTPAYIDGAPFGGKALSFDGTGKAIVTVPLNISVKALKQVTIGAWVMARKFDTPEYGIVSNDDGGYDRTLDIDARDEDPGTNWSAFVGGKVVGKAPVVANNWVFIAVSYDQSKLPGSYAFYVVDGNDHVTLSGPDDFDNDSVTARVTIGSNPNFDQAFNGAIANLFFYKGILSDDQIDAISFKGPSAIPGYKKP